MLAEDEPKLRQLIEVGAIGFDVQLGDQGTDDGRRPGQQRRASVHSHLARISAHALPLVGNGNIVHLHLPIPFHIYVSVGQGAGHAILLDLAECNLRLFILLSAKKHGEQILLENTVPHHAVENVERLALRHLRQGQSHDTIKRYEAERLVRLVRCSHEIRVGADVPHTDVILHEHARNLARSKRNSHHITGAIRAHHGVRRIGEGDLTSSHGERGVVSLV
mmetsp:Transcript_37304/g.89717  ORF Transcript_37304/g.89717 Transcript_37304/m.89717 type:complete len:221 (+) Transcript_37304:565-1227(+)